MIAMLLHHQRLTSPLLVRSLLPFLGLLVVASLPAQERPEKPTGLSRLTKPDRVKELQQAWATYLGVPVEEKVDLGKGVTLELVLIPPGKFYMGSPEEEKSRLPNEGPQHTANLSRAFYLGKYEVTQEQWEQVMGSNPSWFSLLGEGKELVSRVDTKRFPVERISFDDAQAFLRKTSTKERTYRLPTEAEWEYACRGGMFAKNSSPFQIGEDYLDSLSSNMASFDGSRPYGDGERGKKRERPVPVGTFAANPFGLFDMHGNVQEWCQDRFAADSYKDAPSRDPTGPTAGAEHVLRGGAWNSPGEECRAAARRGLGRSWRYNDVGLRVAWTPPSP
jgi:formylglycine-generating enzyme required for sulfatase activity